MQDDYDETRGRARIGVIVPVSNTNLEPDLMMLLPSGLSLHFARSGGYDIDQIPDEKQMQQYSDSNANDIIDSLRICRSDILLYGCTSATLAQGPAYDQQFRHNMEKIAGVPAVTAASALVEVLAALGVRRFAFTSPYVASLNDLAISFIEEAGMSCCSRLDAAEPMSNDAVSAATPTDIIEQARQLDLKEADAIVISCTDYRATEAIPAIEAVLGKPVVSSNLAMLLVALKRLGIKPENARLQSCMVAARF